MIFSEFNFQKSNPSVHVGLLFANCLFGFCHFNLSFQSDFINKEMFETSIFSIKTTLIFLSLRPKIEKGING